MKNLFSVLILMTAFCSFSQEDEIDSSQDKIKVEQAVVRWADSIFYKHSEYKFENFRAEYSEGYYIAVMRSRAYKERVEDFEKDKAAGRYKGTEEAYLKELQTLKDAYTKAQNDADNYVNRADYFIIHFWSNIQTTDGITVYYEHIIKLDNFYNVIEATINSAIGKKDENTQILYKKDVKVNSTDKKKVDNGAQNQKTVDTPTDNSNGSSNSTVNNSSTTEKESTNTTVKKEKKKKKNK